MNIEDVNTRIKELNQIKRLLSINIEESDSIQEKIFKKYLHEESIAKVAKYINSLGYKNGNRKYIAQDISFIITDKNTEIRNKQLKGIVVKIFNNHKKGIKRSNWKL